MTTFNAPPHTDIRYDAFVDPERPDGLHAPESPSVPRVDDQLVRPETREEMVRGRMVYAAPAKEPHADRHNSLNFVTGGCIAPGYIASSDLLTRAGPRSDFATDTCIRREGIDPSTGARYLEELAFEIVAEQSQRSITERAQDLSARGVRRLIAIFVKRGEVCEWSPERDDWIQLGLDDVLEDPTLAEPIPIRALLDQTEASRAVVRGLHAKGDPELRSIEARALEQGLEQGRMQMARTAIETLCEVLDIPLDPERQAHLQQLDAPSLEVLFDRLRRDRRWP